MLVKVIRFFVTALLAVIGGVIVHLASPVLGIGSGIVNMLIEEGRELGVKTFFTLTYKPKFFESLGFTVVSRDDLPHKIWKDCIDCPKFPDCDEIALIRRE